MHVLLFCGLQAAGKSTFYREHFLTTHVLISKDLLRNNSRPARRQNELLHLALEVLAAGLEGLGRHGGALGGQLLLGRLQLLLLLLDLRLEALALGLQLPLDALRRQRLLQQRLDIDHGHGDRRHAPDRGA